MLTLPESSDEYHTPPDHQRRSETSSIEAQILPPTNTSAFDAGDGDPVPVDDDSESYEQRVVDLPNPLDKLGFSEKNPRVPEDNHTHQVFVEMRQREQEAGNKRKLPFSMNRQMQTISSSKNEPFVNILNRVLKMVQEAKRSRGGEEEEDHDDDIDFLETAGMDRKYPDKTHLSPSSKLQRKGATSCLLVKSEHCFNSALTTAAVGPLSSSMILIAHLLEYILGGHWSCNSCQLPVETVWENRETQTAGQQLQPEFPIRADVKHDTKVVHMAHRPKCTKCELGWVFN
ncbi:hypothetical protein E3N88_07865 [Mikania micrantha]|uniref:Uncharacterized protein n=1 Tax=Mikania micrantha TaxID=192012 RepID=A0A5N6PEK1_9ASTR|nr:hypothetical protein E3N88_07865 [Mikania micrantha]